MSQLDKLIDAAKATMERQFDHPGGSWYYGCGCYHPEGHGVMATVVHTCETSEALGIYPHLKPGEKRYGGADNGTCGVEFFRKDINHDSVCGRNPCHEGPHSWYRDCWSCKGVAGEHNRGCNIYPPCKDWCNSVQPIHEDGPCNCKP